MTTPIPALFPLVNLASAQLIFTKPWSGGFHFCIVGGTVRIEEGCRLTTWNSCRHSFASWVIRCRLQPGLLSWTWFRYVQMDQAVIEKSSSWCWCLINHDSRFFKGMKLSELRQLHKVKSSQTTSNSPHNHKAWRVDSLAQEHRSHKGFSIMVQRTKFALVRREFRQALHIKFFTLFGTCNDQIPCHNSLSSTNRAAILEVSSSNFKNWYPNLLVYVPVWVKGQKSLSSTLIVAAAWTWLVQPL